MKITFSKKYNSITEYAKKCKEQGCPISFITKRKFTTRNI